MKFILTFLASFCFLFTTITAQTVPCPTHETDQLTQGPCYTFAIVAALESNAIQNDAPQNVNFNEWLFFSTCVFGPIGGSPKNNLESQTQHMVQHGAFSGPHNHPNLENCPNKDDASAECVASFDCADENSWCQTNQMYVSVQSPEQEGCIDEDGQKFQFEPSGDIHYQLTEGSDLIKITFEENDNKAEIITEILEDEDKKRGVIGIFPEWEPMIEHCLFIYRRVETQNPSVRWKYKDSWPGDNEPSMKTGELPLEKLREIYYIDGNVITTEEVVEGPTCLNEINGPSVVKETQTYTLSGTGQSNISWSVSSNLTIVGAANSNSVKVKPACYNSSGYIRVNYNGTCEEDFEVYVKGKSPTPTKIVVPSPNWNSKGETCPNTRLEIAALVNENYTNLKYEWEIIGATVISGQENSSVEVMTPPGNSNLIFRVRTKRENCPASEWVEITGYSSPWNNGCEGGQWGGGKFLVTPDESTLNFTELFKAKTDLENLQVAIYNINGTTLFQGKVANNDPNMMVNDLIPNGIVVIHLFDPVTGYSKSFKQWIGVN